jgi:hypothetical protein
MGLILPTPESAVSQRQIFFIEHTLYIRRLMAISQKAYHIIIMRAKYTLVHRQETIVRKKS